MALWTLPGLLYSMQIYEIGIREDSFTTAFFDAMIHALPVWWFWVPVTPLLVWLSRKFPIRRSGAIREIAIHLAISVLVALLLAAFAGLWFSSTPPFDSRDRTWSSWTTALLLSTTIHLYFFSYWLIVAAVHFLDHERRLREQEITTARLDALAAQSRMKLLSHQLQPHFLFNALNGLSTLILRGDTAAAQGMLGSLADFLRATLRADDMHLVPLRDELDLLAKYLDVERVRWGDRLKVRMEIDPTTEGALVPTLLLQPLAENAIRHGIGSSETGGEIVVRANRTGNSLRLQIENDGSGLSPGWRDRADRQIGLVNTRRRLSLLFEDEHDMRIEELSEGRVSVSLEFPFRLVLENEQPIPSGSAAHPEIRE